MSTVFFPSTSILTEDQLPAGEIRTEQLRLMAERDTNSTQIALAGIGLVLASQWHTAAWRVLLAFVVLRLLALWFSHHICRQVQRQGASEMLQRGALLQLELGLLAAGLSWGLTAWLLPDSMSTEVAGHFLLLILIGVTGVMVGVTALTRRGLMFFVIGLWCMVSLRMVWFIDPYGRYLLGGSILYGVLSVMFGLQLHAQLKAGIVAMLRERHARRRVDRIELEHRALQQEQIQLRRQLAEAQAKTESLAITDELTGALNRRAFHERAAIQLAALHRHDEPSALLMLDLDHFKQINESRGTQVGDQLLRRIVSSLQGTLRGADLLARWGGDKFLIFMPRTSATEGCAAAGRLHQALFQLAISSVREMRDMPPLSACIGVAEMQADITLEAAVARAERGLYAAKQLGIGRIVMAGPNQKLSEFHPGHTSTLPTLSMSAVSSSTRAG